MQCLRADDIWDHDAVIQDVVSLINRSRVVVCDCTERNANVFYEAGIAHRLGKECDPYSAKMKLTCPLICATFGMSAT